jgi:GT2 family glycosyltransferase
MTAPCVSVVIPCYKQAHFLKECVASLRAQSHDQWEAVIVDDGSPDHTADVVQQLAREDPRVRLVRKSNGGLSSARNAGLANVRGDFIQFLDADDLLEPDKLSIQLHHLMTHTAVDLVYGNVTYFFDDDPANRVRNPFWDGSPQRDWITERAGASEPLLERLVHGNLFPVCAPLMRASLLHRVGSFNTSLPALEDWEYWIRCAAAGGVFSFADRPGSQALVRVHRSSMTHDKLRMSTAAVQMRATTLHYIRDQPLRVLTLSRLVESLRKLPAERRPSLASLNLDLRRLDERYAVRIADFVSAHTPHSLWMRTFLKALPWRLRVVAAP